MMGGVHRIGRCLFGRGLLLIALALAAAITSSGLSAEPPPRRPPPQQTPDERQAAMMKAMGYTWDGTRWGRGDAASHAKNRASARSGNRFARFVDAQGGPASSPAAVAASKRLGEVLMAAREGALGRTEEERAHNRDYKDLLSKPAAPAVWLAAQFSVLVAASSVGGVDWSAELRGTTPLAIGLGVAAGVVLSECRARYRRCQPGVEEPDGALERLLADAVDGSYALPAPAHVRHSSERWAALAAAGEAVAAVNVAVVLQGVAQPALLRASNGIVWRLVQGTSGTTIGESVAVLSAAGAAVAVSLPALARAARQTSGPFDGIPAECEAVRRARRGAGAYFNMGPPTDANAMDAAEALILLTDAWVDKFGAAEGSKAQLPLLAFAGSVACATAWQLVGGGLIAPTVARVVASYDTYILRPEKEAHRASVQLPLPQGSNEQWS